MRLPFFLILIGVTVAAVGWFATDPGTLVFTFRGWRVETSVGIAVLAVAVLTAVLIGIYAVLAGLLRAPKRLRTWRDGRRLRRGLKALAAGMVAVAAGDARGARRAAGKAESAGAETPLTLLLSAQAAQLEGDDRAAEKYFTAMLARPETEFLALRGLIVQAARRGDDARALEYAKRAAKLRPDAGWAQAAEFELAVKQEKWSEAESALKRAIRRGGITTDNGQRHRATLLLMQSRGAERSGFAVEALSLARRARRAAPDFVPAALAEARLQREQGSTRRARRALERAYARNPHPELARALLAFAKGEGEALAHDRLRIAQRLLDLSADAPESYFGAAEAALDAQIWGRARRHLDDAEAALAARAGASPDGTGNAEASGGAGLPARLYRLRARLEEGETGDARAAGHWLHRAATAAPDPRWVCRACGTTQPAWTGLCPSCKGFDTYEWRAPAPVAVIGAESPVLSALSAPASSPGPGAGSP